MDTPQSLAVSANAPTLEVPSGPLAFGSAPTDACEPRLCGRFGLVEFWSATGRWPDFCFEPGHPYDCKAEAAKFRAN